MTRRIESSLIVGLNRIVFLLILFTPLVLSSCIQSEQNGMKSVLAPQSVQEPIVMKLSGYPSTHLPEESLAVADIVLLGRITGRGQTRWNTSDGGRPQSPTACLMQNYMIYSTFRFEVTRIIRGEVGSDANMLFAVAGGQIGKDVADTGEAIDFYSDISVGDDALLFLRTSTDELTNIAPYTYVDVLRIDQDLAVAGCSGRQQQDECRAVFPLREIISRIDNSH